MGGRGELCEMEVKFSVSIQEKGKAISCSEEKKRTDYVGMTAALFYSNYSTVCCYGEWFQLVIAADFFCDVY